MGGLPIRVSYAPVVGFRNSDAKANSAPSSQRYYSSGEQYYRYSYEADGNYAKRLREKNPNEYAKYDSAEFVSKLENSNFFKVSSQYFKSDNDKEKLIEQMKGLAMRNEKALDLVLKLPESVWKVIFGNTISMQPARYLRYADADSLDNPTAQTVFPNQCNLNENNLRTLIRMHEENPQGFDTWVASLGVSGLDAIYLGSENIDDYVPNNSSVGLDLSNPLAAEKLCRVDGEEVDTQKADLNADGYLTENELYESGLFLTCTSTDSGKPIDLVVQDIDYLLSPNGRNENPEYLLDDILGGVTELDKFVFERDKELQIGYKTRKDITKSINTLAQSKTPEAQEQYRLLTSISSCPTMNNQLLVTLVQKACTLNSEGKPLYALSAEKIQMLLANNERLGNSNFDISEFFV